ncbi:MAG: hypothetical protein OXE99_15170, partial [Cellvibrionales bacterium]|nr:hypothetical protein [Cellvibrionales bacterium]
GTSERNHLVGIWYSKKESASGITMETQIENFEDGTYRLSERTTYQNGFQSDSLELGQWGFSDGIYFATSRGWVEGCSIVSSDVNDPNTFKAFQVINLSGNSVTYSHADRSESFLKLNKPIKSLAEDSSMSDCSYISRRRSRDTSLG